VTALREKLAQPLAGRGIGETADVQLGRHRIPPNSLPLSCSPREPEESRSRRGRGRPIRGRQSKFYTRLAEAQPRRRHAGQYLIAGAVDEGPSPSAAFGGSASSVRETSIDTSFIAG